MLASRMSRNLELVLLADPKPDGEMGKESCTEIIE
jgi:hypothetical protein